MEADGVESLISRRRTSLDDDGEESTDISTELSAFGPPTSNRPLSPTSLPEPGLNPEHRKQTYLLLVAILPEAIIETMLSPLLPFMVKSMSHNPAEIGYLTGLISGVFYLPLLVTNMLWGSLSDRPTPGPKFILVISVFVCGATTFTAGVFGGASTVVKGSIGDLFRDEVSRAWGYARYGTMYATAGIVGPIIGGLLTHTPVQDSTEFLDRYPFFFPCMFGVLLSVIGFIDAQRYLNIRPRRHPNSEGNAGELTFARIAAPLIKVMTPEVMFPISLYMLIAFCHMSWVTALPLLFASDAVALTPRSTALLLSVISVSKLSFQTFVFRPLVAHFRVRTSYQIGMTALVPAMIGMTIVGQVMRGEGSSYSTWGFTLSVMVLFGFVEAIAYLSVLLMITESVESHSLGSAHGLAATCAAGARTLAPPLAGTFWQLGILWGIPWLVFAVIGGVAAFSVILVQGGFPGFQWRRGYTNIGDNDEVEVLQE
ncbi:hypothetical protein HDU97_003174 [Phlyctochytrium planicorne]|nr:hypothetical protein HDU97_003174 [Phlyctochytrium planicorne]